jgi:transcription antitermination factor NusG
MSARWYVLHSKPNKEELLWEQLTLRNIEVFYPRLRVHPVNPRARQVRAYFPGYVFVHVDMEEVGLSTLQRMPGATGIVSFDNQPSLVPDGLIPILKKRVDEINNREREAPADLQAGELVDIQSGPFAGYEAIFDARLPGSERVRVLLKMLHGRATKIELSADLLVRRGKRR